MNENLLAGVLSDEPMTRRRAIARVAALLGGTASTLALGGLVTGCEGSGAGGGAPAAALSGTRKETLATVVDHIIPATDTPGARAAGVPEFIEVILREGMTEAERNRFLAGLDALDERARREHRRAFLECDASRQREIVAALDAETFRPRPTPRPERRAGDLRHVTEPGAGESPLPPELKADTVQWQWGEPQGAKGPETPFWRTLKRLTLVGYYTSEVGATEELRYEAVPGRFDGCVPLAEIGRTWAV